MHVLRRSSSSHRITMFCLVRSPADLFKRLRSLPGNDQFTLEYSIRYKTAKPAEAIIILLLRRRKASHFESAISCRRTYNPSHRTSADSPPRLSTIESSPATALHSFGSRPCHRLRCSGTFWAHSGSWGPCAQGYLIVWVTGPFLIA